MSCTRSRIRRSFSTGSLTFPLLLTRERAKFVVSRMVKKSGKKKAWKKKKKTGKKSKAQDLPAFESAHAFHAKLALHERAAVRNDWIQLRIVLVNWDHMNFTILTRAVSTIHVIAR